MIRQQLSNENSVSDHQSQYTLYWLLNYTISIVAPLSEKSVEAPRMCTMSQHPPLPGQPFDAARSEHYLTAVSANYRVAATLTIRNFTRWKLVFDAAYPKKGTS